MGNAEQSLKTNNPNEYIQIIERLDGIPGSPALVQSTKTRTELEEYIVKNNDITVPQNIKIYKLRSSSYSKNIVVVFTHQLISEKNQLFRVRTEKIFQRLTTMHLLTYLQALTILEASLSGFAQLMFHAKKPFLITDKMIALNFYPQVRVWFHENFALNEIMITGIMAKNENQMIENIIKVIGYHVCKEDRDKFYSQCEGLAKYKKLIAAKNNVSSILQDANRKQILKELFARQLKKQEQKKRSERQYLNKNLSQSKIRLGLSTSGQKRKPMPNPVGELNASQKKLQMVSQKKLIFQTAKGKMNQTPEKKNRIISYSPSIPSLSKREKSRSLSKSGIKLQSVVKQRERRGQKIRTQPEQKPEKKPEQKAEDKVHESKYNGKIVIGAVTKNGPMPAKNGPGAISNNQYSLKSQQNTLCFQKSTTPKARLTSNNKNYQELNLRKSNANVVLKPQFYYYQRPNQPVLDKNLIREPRFSEPANKQGKVQKEREWNKYEGNGFVYKKNCY